MPLNKPSMPILQNVEKKHKLRNRKFELTKILMDKMKENKSYIVADYKREIYDALVNLYNTDKDLFDTYGKAFMLKRGRDDKDKDQDPSAGSDRGKKRRKSSKRDWYKKVERPPTLDSDWDKRRQIDSQLPQTWISDTLRAEETPNSFYELTDTSFDFYVFVLNRLNIMNVTQELLVGPAFNLLKGTCKSLTELEYHFEECSKATTERLDWHNPKGKPLKIMKWYDYGHLDETKVRREDQQLHVFKEGDFPRLRLQDIEAILLLLVHQKLTNLILDERYDLNVALQMFTRRIVIKRRMRDLRNRTAYTAYSNPQGIIYKDQNQRTRLIRTDEPHKFSDGTLDDVRFALHDITLGIRMKYLPKKYWSNLDKRRAWVMIQNIDKQLFQRILLRNLEMFVGRREYG
nr:hypothetical protein [Tanacetum cinerariifolium]